MRSGRFSTAWKARRSRVIQRARAARSPARRARSCRARRASGGSGSRGRRSRRRRGLAISGALPDLEADAAVGQRLLADGVALLAGLQGGLLHGVGLEEAVEVGLVAPVAAEVVV